MGTMLPAFLQAVALHDKRQCTTVTAGSEDYSFKVWSGAGSCLQTIELPGCVWGIAFDAQDDLIAGTSDSRAYVYSMSSERQTDPAVAEALQNTIAERKAAAQQQSQQDGSVGGGPNQIPEGKIKPESALLMPGQKNNEQLFVRKGGSVWAYVWNAETCEWDTLGEVTGGPSGDTMETPKHVRSLQSPASRIACPSCNHSVGALRMQFMPVVAVHDIKCTSVFFYKMREQNRHLVAHGPRHIDVLFCAVA